MVMGLDDWPVDQGTSEIPEPRLLRAVQQTLGPQVTTLRTLPVAPESVGYQASPFEDPTIGVPVAPRHPSRHCRLLAPIHSGLFELKLDPYRHHVAAIHLHQGQTGQATGPLCPPVPGGL